ncbi:alcohol-forming fatty acyl-CoA reductase isoform X2 [Spinacia oleracea]|uniref:Fatty acyl-CoA reductase n=1 Tax=Spinacia oleracea TaxID=3562 RepID=A0ABM3R285_SPIOL|nr:alcohol-forming fatty acyl-CoA reductase-like isoform X2 [Spinacia oleracea]
MDFGNIIEFLGNRTILITGVTGFIAKILLEKILRIQPNVKKIYLLIRAADAKSANARLQDEVLGKELFKILREKLGADFDCFVSEKVTPVMGDTSYEDLGVDASQLKEMYEDIDIVVNVAATTKYEERYDVALGVNTLGAKHVVNFAKNCAKIKLLIHVSTAYVCGVKAGLISESPYAMGETLNGEATLDIDLEKKLVEQTLINLIEEQVSEKTIRQRMKELGSQRAKLYGWPNTYVFTKAMGEMLVGKHRGNLPVVIMRPTIVCSTLKDPFPGWLESCRTLDMVAVSYGKGSLSFFTADNSSVLDLIPADMLVNSIIVAMKANLDQPYLSIYQVGSSYRNPINFGELHEFHFRYFTKNPWSNHEGGTSPVKIRKALVLSNVRIFEIVLLLCNFAIQLVLSLVRRMGCTSLQQALVNFDKKLKITMSFVDTNTENLLITARLNGLDEDIFNFDPMSVNWKHYFFQVHLPAVVKYLF